MDRLPMADLRQAKCGGVRHADNLLRNWTSPGEEGKNGDVKDMGLSRLSTLEWTP